VAPVLKTYINSRRDPLRWPRDALYPQKLALTSPTSGGRSVGIVRVRTKSHGVFHIPFHHIIIIIIKRTGIAIRYSDEAQIGWPGFDSRLGQETFRYSSTSRQAPGPTQPPIQWVPGALAPGIKRPGREAPSSAQVKNGGAIPPLPCTS
jgi:hypothetical protein